jgi:hypothetical protein
MALLKINWIQFKNTWVLFHYIYIQQFNLIKINILLDLSVSVLKNN